MSLSEIIIIRKRLALGFTHHLGTLNNDYYLPNLLNGIVIII
jgi:hypothetical protein